MAQQLLFVPANASEYAPPLGRPNALPPRKFNPRSDDQLSPCGGRPRPCECSGARHNVGVAKLGGHMGKFFENLYLVLATGFVLAVLIILFPGSGYAPPLGEVNGVLQWAHVF